MFAMRVAALGAALFLGAGTGAAFAGDAGCLWKAMPEAARAEVTAAYARSLSDGLDADSFTEEAFMKALADCGATDETAADAGQALAGYEMETHTRLWLLKRPGVDAAKFDAAWADAVTPATSQVLTAVIMSEDGDLQEASEPVITDLAARLGLAQTGELSEYLGTYIYGRLSREAFEKKF